MELDTIRTAAKGAIDRAGYGDAARKVRAQLQPKSRRRNQRDDDELRRLITLGLCSDSSCVDIGANVGVILSTIVAAAPRGTHLAFEPVASLADDLESRFPTVDVRRAAAADTPGRTAFTVVLDAPSRSGLAPANVPISARTELVDVEVVRLDDVLPAGFTPRLLKVDVEGSELEALRGAADTIANNDLMVAYEHGHGLNPADLDHCDALYSLLADLGLRVFDMDGRELDRRAYHRVYLDGSRWNFLARR